MPNRKSLARELAELNARGLFIYLSDNFSIDGVVQGKSHQLLGPFADALELAFEKGVTEGMKRALTGAAA
jgi:hypothetical protein